MLNNKAVHQNWSAMKEGCSNNEGKTNAQLSKENVYKTPRRLSTLLRSRIDFIQANPQIIFTGINRPL